jgi:predicted PurR-regulated permease PerM
MKDIFKFDKKYFKISLYVVISICVILFFYQIISNPTDVFDWLIARIRGFFKWLSPVLYGFVIAYLLHKPCSWLEAKIRNLKRIKFKKQTAPHAWAVLIVNFLALVLLGLVMYAIVPNIVASIGRLATQADQFITPIQEMLDRLSSNTVVVGFLNLFNIDLTSVTDTTKIMEWLSAGQEILQTIGNSLLDFVLTTGTFLYNFVLGFIIAIYVNLDFVKLKHQASKFFHAILPRRYNRMVYLGDMANRLFLQYLIGKALCSLIVGVVYYIFCLIFHVEYALFVAFIVDITNMIQFIGPFIGAIPAFIFSLLTGVNTAIIMMIIIIVLQQIDGNILAPKIIGNSVKLNGFWIIVSVILCGKIAGVLGMIVAIPVFAMLRNLVSEWIQKREKKISERNAAGGVEITGNMAKSDVLDEGN